MSVCCLCEHTRPGAAVRENFHHKATEQTDSRLEPFGYCFIQGSRRNSKGVGEVGSNPSLLVQLPVNSEAQLAKTKQTLK